MNRLPVLMIWIAVGLFLVPAVLLAPPVRTAAGKPPIAQPLVREGDLALDLADALRLGPAGSEAEAESILSSLAIAPRNGWVSDYPVTPDIVGELQESLSLATDAGRLKLSKKESLAALKSVETGLGLAIAPDGSGSYVGGQPPSNENGGYDAEETDDYYENQGTPVVTYYPPPSDYYSLYSWVPYPFWYADAWFGGFFVLNDFDVVVVNRHRHHGHHPEGYGSRTVTNRVRDSRTGKLALIDPAGRTTGHPLNTIADAHRISHRGSPESASVKSGGAGGASGVASHETGGRSRGDFTTERRMPQQAPSGEAYGRGFSGGGSSQGSGRAFGGGGMGRSFSGGGFGHGGGCRGHC